ncbi:MAG: hypothetical protein ABI353_23060 [Isosphaeraceae bacterium]
MTTILEPPATADAPARKPRSGGPRTQAGKDAARRNALKHGMRAEVLIPDDLAELVADRTIQFNDQFRPASPYEEWLIGQVAKQTALLDRCGEMAIADLQRQVDRASVCWDADRRENAAALGAKLSRNPALTVASLRTTTHGVAWLIERWESLGEILRQTGAWDETQRTLALDLLGTPLELRAASRALPLDAGVETLSALANAQVAELRASQVEGLDNLDADDRERTEMGATLILDPATRLLRRHESDCQRTLHWSLNEFRRVHSSNPPTHSPQPFRPDPPPSSDSDDLRAALFARLMLAAAEAAGAVEASEIAEIAETSEPIEATGDTETSETAETTARPPTPGRRARRAREQQARQAAKRAAKRAGQGR